MIQPDQLIVRMSLKIKGCDKQFHKEFSPGVIATKDVKFTVTPSDRKSPQLAVAILNHGEAFMQEWMEVLVEEVSDSG